MRLRVALSALSVKPGRTGGGETVLVHLINELIKVDSNIEYLLFVTKENRDLFAGNSPSLSFCIAPSWVRSVASRIVFEMIYMPREISRWKANIFFAVNQVASPLISCFVSAFVQNLLYYNYGSLYNGKRHLSLELRRIFFRLLGRRSVRNAKQVIAVSQQVRQTLIDRDGVEDKRIRVVPLAPSLGLSASVVETGLTSSDIRSRMGRPFLLYVGALEPYKNIDRAIVLLGHLRNTPELVDLGLVIVGMDMHGYGKDLQRIAAQVGVEEAVKIVGSVPHGELSCWYKASEGLILLSECEAFPLVPFEAMVCGVPVITSNLSALPEVVGDGGIIVDPYDEINAARAIHKLLTDSTFRQTLIARGTLRSREFSWRRTATELVRHWRVDL